MQSLRERGLLRLDSGWPPKGRFGGGGNRHPPGCRSSHNGKHACFTRGRCALGANAPESNRNSDIQQTQRLPLWRNEESNATAVLTHKVLAATCVSTLQFARCRCQAQSQVDTASRIAPRCTRRIDLKKQHPISKMNIVKLEPISIQLLLENQWAYYSPWRP